jgi:hypothetical protein
MVPRVRPLWPDAPDNPFSTHRGEVSLYVWCSWRLDGPEDALASSDQDPETFMPVLTTLVGREVTSVNVGAGACDLLVQFGDLALRVFCDHVLPDPSFDGNWEAVVGEIAVAVGPGHKAEIEPVRDED